MKRRNFVAMIGGAAVGWPPAVQAQQRDGLRRLGVLMGSANNPISQTLTAAFLQGLGAFNWHEGGNLRIDWRWVGGDRALFKRYAGELVALDPDVLVANGSKAVEALRRRQEVIQGTVLVDVPFPDEPSLEQIHSDLLIGDVETVAEKLVSEIRATHPVHMCFRSRSGRLRTRRRCAQWS